MLRLVPDKIFKDITKITPDILEEENIHALILDIDNTLASRNEKMPDRKIAEWVEKIKKTDVKLIIISNNHKNRVERISKALGLQFRCHGLKPFPHSFLWAAEKMGVRPNETAAVGDQIYTDICGARFAGVKAWLVIPIDTDEGILIRFRRFFEKPFIKKYYKESGVKNK